MNENKPIQLTNLTREVRTLPAKGMATDNTHAGILPLNENTMYLLKENPPSISICPLDNISKLARRMASGPPENPEAQIVCRMNKSSRRESRLQVRGNRRSALRDCWKICRGDIKQQCPRGFRRLLGVCAEEVAALALGQTYGEEETEVWCWLVSLMPLN